MQVFHEIHLFLFSVQKRQKHANLSKFNLHMRINILNYYNEYNVYAFTSNTFKKKLFFRYYIITKGTLIKLMNSPVV